MDLSVTATPHGLQPETRGVNAYEDDASLRRCSACIWRRRI